MAGKSFKAAAEAAEKESLGVEEAVGAGEAEAEERVRIRKTTQKAVNVREEPGMGGAALGQIGAGDFGWREATREGGWYAVEGGYVLGSLFEEEGAAE